MLRREGFTVNHKRVERIYRAEGLSLRRRQKRKRLSHLRVLRPLPTGTTKSGRWTSSMTVCGAAGDTARSHPAQSLDSLLHQPSIGYRQRHEIP
jgi:transposase InsO family protein